MRVIAAFLVLSACCFAQSAKSGEIGTVGGFLDVCGRDVSSISKEQMAAMSKAPAGDFMHTLNTAMDENMTDHLVCFAYLTGLIHGWQEGHEHGVLAVEFPAGVPDRVHLATALESVPDKDLKAAHVAMNNDVLCLPEHMSNGEAMDAVLKYARNYVRDNPLLRVVPTSRIFAAALRDAFPCPAAASGKK